MAPHVFKNVCDIIRLRYTRNGITVHEMLGMFLLVISYGTLYAIVTEMIRYSKETVSRAFKKLLPGIQELSHVFITQRNVVVKSKIENDQRWRYFQANIVPYHDRNAKISQNVLVAYSRDMMFTYFMTGCEGSVHDSRIFFETATLELFPASRGGFSNISGYLAPYKGERYHRSNFPQHNLPTLKKELFNQRHASVRNVIKSCFSILKRRFVILRLMTNF
ncbi:uncharacterized protein LOC116206798 isoform X2 [Punica granatum]|nr:uncharacterized protein LOC116206798 isoform X2 [Punica granatum]